MKQSDLKENWNDEYKKFRYSVRMKNELVNK